MRRCIFDNFMLAVYVELLKKTDAVSVVFIYIIKRWNCAARLRTSLSVYINAEYRKNIMTS